MLVKLISPSEYLARSNSDEVLLVGHMQIHSLPVTVHVNGDDWDLVGASTSPTDHQNIVFVEALFTRQEHGNAS